MTESKPANTDNLATETVIHTGRAVKLRKCTYTAHCAAIWSVEHAIQVLDKIAAQTDSDDCLPFAMRLVENGELILIAEDNGEFACGDLLAECLSKLDKYNVLVCVSRKIRDSFVLDMYQGQKFNSIKEAANSAIDIIHAHFTGIEAAGIYSSRIPESSDDERSVVVRLPAPNSDRHMVTPAPPKEGKEKEKEKEKLRPTAPMTRVSIDLDTMFPSNDMSAAGKDPNTSARMSSTKRKLKESILRSRAMS
jgi:hypothetical protein